MKAEEQEEHGKETEGEREHDKPDGQKNMSNMIRTGTEKKHDKQEGQRRWQREATRRPQTKHQDKDRKKQ